MTCISHSSLRVPGSWHRLGRVLRPTRRSTHATPFLLPSLLFGLLVLVPTLAGATEVKIFRADRRQSFVSGTLERVALDPEGALSLATRLDDLAAIEEPFAYSTAPHPDGWVVGTGSSGKVLLVDHEGAVRTLFETEASNIFTVWTHPNGDVYAASSPEGAVYRLAAGAGAEEAEKVFEPDATYIWELTSDGRDGVLVATGLPGHVYRIGRDGESEQLIDTGERHVRTVVAGDDGTLLIGTAGRGRILQRDPDGRVHTRYDGAQPEVVDLALAGDGSVYAALLASESSLVDLSAANGSQAAKSGEGSEGTVEVSTQGQTTTGSRPAGSSGARSVLLHLAPDAAPRQVWSHADDTVHSLLWQPGASDDDGVLWLGTGEEGRLYRWADRRMILEHDLEPRQVTALVPSWTGSGKRGSTSGAAVLTTNDAALHVLKDAPGADGTYTSSVLDAGSAADFGTFFWQGEVPEGARLELGLRTGMAKSPDGTWSDWNTLDVTTLRGDEEIVLDNLATGRYLQWRATFHGSAEKSPRLTRIEISYRQRNQQPEITELEVLDPGKVLVPSSFNPQNQTYEPWSPNRDGIFTSLKGSDGKDDSSRLKTLWKRGYRTLRWKASDANEDSLRYTLAFRVERGAFASDRWLPMVDDLDETHFSFDATALPDGIYRFRLTASDRRAQPDHVGLEAIETSGPVVIDHTPPRLERVARAGQGTDAHVEVEVVDATNPLRNAVYSADGQAWIPAVAADGLLDGRRETLRIRPAADAELLLLRVTDAAWNVVTFDLLAAPDTP